MGQLGGRVLGTALHMHRHRGRLADLPEVLALIAAVSPENQRGETIHQKG